MKPKREWKEGKVHWSSAKEIYLKQTDKEHIKSMKLKTLASTIHQRLEKKNQQNPKNKKPLKNKKPDLQNLL
jgi:hypothetical protein